MLCNKRLSPIILLVNWWISGKNCTRKVEKKERQRKLSLHLSSFTVAFLSSEIKITVIWIQNENMKDGKDCCDHQRYTIHQTFPDQDSSIRMFGTRKST
ncbi:Transcriptional regulatory protein [Dirofilaria immitis]